MRMYNSILYNNDCYKQGKPLTPKGVMVHSTGVNNSHISRYVQVPGGSSMHWNKPGIAKCVHAFIGRWTDGTIATCKSLPFDMKGWHSGPGTKPKSANSTHIGFEICEDDLKHEDYFRAVYKEATEFTAYLCGLYGLDPLKDGVVISHHEGHLRGVASNHADIDHWLKIYGLTMDNFRNDVAKLMEGGDILTYEEWKAFAERYEKERAVLPTSDWAVNEGSVAWAKKNKILLKPTREHATKEEIASALYRACQVLAEKVKEAKNNS